VKFLNRVSSKNNYRERLYVERKKNDFDITPVQKSQYNKNILEDSDDRVVLDLEYMMMKNIE